MAIFSFLILIMMKDENLQKEPVEVQVIVSQNGRVISESVSERQKQKTKLKDLNRWRKLLANEVGFIQLD